MCTVCSECCKHPSKIAIVVLIWISLVNFLLLWIQHYNQCFLKSQNVKYDVSKQTWTFSQFDSKSVESSRESPEDILGKIAKPEPKSIWKLALNWVLTLKASNIVLLQLQGKFWILSHFWQLNSYQTFRRLQDLL